MDPTREVLTLVARYRKVILVFWVTAGVVAYGFATLFTALGRLPGRPPAVGVIDIDAWLRWEAARAAIRPTLNSAFTVLAALFAFPLLTARLGLADSIEARAQQIILRDATQILSGTLVVGSWLLIPVTWVKDSPYALGDLWSMFAVGLLSTTIFICTPRSLDRTHAAAARSRSRIAVLLKRRQEIADELGIDSQHWDAHVQRDEPWLRRACRFVFSREERILFVGWFDSLIPTGLLLGMVTLTVIYQGVGWLLLPTILLAVILVGYLEWGTRGLERKRWMKSTEGRGDGSSFGLYG